MISAVLIQQEVVTVRAIYSALLREYGSGHLTFTYSSGQFFANVALADRTKRATVLLRQGGGSGGVTPLAKRLSIVYNAGRGELKPVDHAFFTRLSGIVQGVTGEAPLRRVSTTGRRRAHANRSRSPQPAASKRPCPSPQPEAVKRARPSPGVLLSLVDLRAGQPPFSAQFAVPPRGAPLEGGSALCWRLVDELQRASEHSRYAVALARRHEEHMEAAAQREHEHEHKHKSETRLSREHGADAVEDELHRFEVEEYDEGGENGPTNCLSEANGESASQQQQQQQPRTWDKKEERGRAAAGRTRSSEAFELSLKTAVHGRRNAPRLRSQATECLVAHLADAMRGADGRVPLEAHPLVKRHGLLPREVRGLFGAFMRVCSPLVPIQTLRRAAVAHSMHATAGSTRDDLSSSSSSSQGASVADIVDGEKYRAEQQPIGARADAPDTFTLYVI